MDLRDRVEVLLKEPDSSDPYDPVEVVTNALIENNCCMVYRVTKPTAADYDREFWYLGATENFLDQELRDEADWSIEVSIMYQEEDKSILIYFSQIGRNEIIEFACDLLALDTYSIRFVEVNNHLTWEAVHFITFSGSFPDGCGFVTPFYQ